MKQLNFLSWILITCFICSCTITKRHFGPGYHLEWKRKIAASDSEQEINKLHAVENNNVVSEDKGDADSLIFSTGVATQNEIKTDDIQVQQTTEQVSLPEPAIRSKEIQTLKKPLKSDQKKPENEDEPKRRMHPLMWGIWAMWSIAIVCMFFVTFYAEVLIGVGLGFFIAMIFACIVIRGLRKHPEKYRLKGLSYGFAIPAIVLGGIALAGLAIYLLGGIGISY